MLRKYTDNHGKGTWAESITFQNIRNLLFQLETSDVIFAALHLTDNGDCVTIKLKTTKKLSLS